VPAIGAAVVEDRGRGRAGIGVAGEIDFGAVEARAVPFARRGFGGRGPNDGQDDEIGDERGGDQDGYLAHGCSSKGAGLTASIIGSALRPRRTV
jgi:hypothetical protein